MILKESCKTVFSSQHGCSRTQRAKRQIMPLLAARIPQADFNIKAPKIKVVESIVIKQLLPDIDEPVRVLVIRGS